MAKTSYLTAEEARRIREANGLRVALAGSAYRAKAFSDTYAPDYLSQWHDKSSLDQYYNALAEQKRDAELLRYYTANYGAPESYKSLADLDNLIGQYQGVLDNRSTAYDQYAQYATADDYNAAMREYRENFLPLWNYDIEANQALLDQYKKDQEIYEGFVSAIGIGQPLSVPIYDKNGNEIYFSDYYGYEGAENLATEEEWEAALDSVNRTAEIRRLEGELSAARLAQSSKLDSLSDFGEFSVGNDAAAQTLKGEKFDKLLTPEEQARYYYLYNTQGADKATQYAADLEENLRQRQLQNMYEWSQKNWGTGFLSSLASIGTNIYASLEGAGNMVNYLMNAGLSELEASNAARYTNALRSGVADSSNSAIAAFLYNTMMSGADSMIASLIPGGSLLLGASSAAQKINSEIDRGASSEEAFWSGLAAGTFEMLFESASIGNIKKIRNFVESGSIGTIKDALKQVAVSMGVNATEEMATEVANIMWDSLVTGVEDWRGMDSVMQVVESGLSGALMGGGMATAQIGASYLAKNRKMNRYLREVGKEIRTAADGEKVISNYLNTAKSFGADNTAYKAAEKYEKEAASNKPSDRKLNKLTGKLATKTVRESFKMEARKNATNNLATAAEKAQIGAQGAVSNAKDFDVSQSKKAKVVDFAGSSLKDIVLEVNGEHKAASDVTFDNDETPLLYTYATMLGSTEAANEFVQRYSGQNMQSYFNEFLMYQLMGETAGAAKWESILNSGKAGVTDNTVRFAAMKTGLAIRDAERNRRIDESKKIASEYKRLGGQEKKGKLDTSALRTYALDEHQQASVDFARVLSESLGLNITFYVSQKGNRDKGDGFYDPKTNTIHLDIEAGIANDEAYAAVNSALMSALAHEVVHNMAVNTPEAYGALRDFVVDWLREERGAEFESEILDIMESQNLSREDAIEELVALTCEDLLLSSKELVKALTQFQSKDADAAKTFIEKVQEVLKRILEFFKLAQHNRSEQASLLAQSAESVIKEAQKLFDNALLSLREANMATNTVTEMATLNTPSVQVSKDGTIKLRQRQYRETGRDTLLSYFTEQYGTATAQDMIATIDNIYAVIDAVREENPDLEIFSRWQETETELDSEGKPIFTTDIKNGDYKLNQDFSRVCKKRRQLDEVLNWLASKEDFDVAYLTKEDYKKINDVISSHGFEVACALCFVDAKRFRQSEWADSFANTWNDILYSVVPKGTKLTPFNFATDNPNIEDEGISIDTSAPVTYRKWSQGKEDVKNRRSYESFDHMISMIDGKYVEGNTNVRHIAELIRDNPQLRHSFRGADIISSKGFDTIQRLVPSLRQILNGWGGTSAPKSSSLDVGYDNSILNITGYNKKAAYAVGGVRMNSFSDFISHMFFDYCQAFADLYAKGLPMQAYSKELDFFRLFGKTGGKLNMSGIPGPRPGEHSRLDVEKRFAGLDVTAVSEATGKPINKLTVEDCLDHLDLCEYVWAKESIDIPKATLLQSGILYDKLSESEIAECYKLIREGNMQQALDLAGEDRTDTEYAENIGIIAVGVSDPHIRKLLRDPTIRMVIPYHKSGLNQQVAKAMHIYSFKNYTDYQSTRVKKANGTESKLSSAGDIKNAIGGDFNFYDYFGKTIDGVLYDGKRTAQRYIEWCREKSTDEYTIIPKFSDFTNEENYYKLLEDFDCYNTLTEEHAPQDAVYFGEGALPSDYKEVLVKSLKSEQKVRDDFRATLDGTGMREEILDIVRRRGYEGEKNRLRGKNKYGIEVYEISEKIKNLSIKERQKAFLDIMKNEYQGRTARFVRNGHTFYARFDDKDIEKNIYGDKKSDRRGWKAKINAGADGDIFDLVENSKYDGSSKEIGKNIAAHKGVNYWDYFVKTVQIDNRVYDLVANVRKKADDSFVYSIQLNENKKIEASPLLGPETQVVNRMLNASATIVPQNSDLSIENDEKNKNRLRQSTPSASKVLQSIFEEDPTLQGYAEYRRSLLGYKRMLESREAKLRQIEDIDANIDRLKSERRQSGKGSRMYDLQQKKARLQADADELQKRMFAAEAGDLFKLVEKRRAQAVAVARKSERERAKQKSMERTENISKRYYIERVEKRSLDLMDKLKKNSKDKHIPDAIKEPIAEMLKLLDFSSQRSLTGGAATQKQMRLDQAMEKVSQALQGKSFSADLDLPPEFIPQFEELKKEVQDIYVNAAISGGFTLEQMSSESLKTLNRALLILQHSVIEMNRLIENASYATAVAAAKSSGARFAAVRGSRTGKKQNNKAIAFVNYENLTPINFFERMGPAAYSMFEEMMEGQSTYAKLVEQLQEFAKASYDIGKVRKWQKDIEYFQIAGNDVYMTVPQIMNLYCLAKREQAKKHMYDNVNGEGIIVSEIDARHALHKKQESLGKEKQNNTPVPFKVTEELVKEITDRLSDEQKAVADSIQTYMSTVGSSWGNAVSMHMYGIKSFTEPHYMPIFMVDSKKQDVESGGSKRATITSLLRRSWTNEVKENATGAIEVHDIFDVFANHMVEMAMYRAYAIPVRDMLKWMDTEVDSGGVTADVLKLMELTYGREAKDYLENFLVDLNNGQQAGRGSGFWNKLVSNYKITAVAAKASVAALQGTSYIRVANEMGWGFAAKVFKHPLPNQAMRGYKEALEHSGIVKWKNLGYFQIDVSAPVTNKIKGQGIFMDKVSEASFYLIEKADQLTMGNIWNAMKEQVKADRKDLAVGSKEFFSEVSKRFEKLMYKTQVVDSPLTRSQLMRSKNAAVKAATSFMSEATMTLNSFVAPFNQFSDAKKAGDKDGQRRAANKIARATGVYLTIAAMNAVIRSLFDVLYDDEKEKEFGEEYLKNLIANTISEVLPTNMIPFVRELDGIIFTIINDIFDTNLPVYAGSRMETAFIEYIEKSAAAFGRGDAWKGIWHALRSASQLSGIPLFNVVRDLIAMWNSTVGEIDNDLTIPI